MMHPRTLGLCLLAGLLVLSVGAILTGRFALAQWGACTCTLWIVVDHIVGLPGNGKWPKP